MIVIIGETHDDVLYFDSVLANRREETILGKYKVSIGTIFSQDALIAYNLFTSSLASAVLMHILDHYIVDLIISVGRCMAISDKIKNGDIVVSTKVIDANVDLTMFGDVATAQIPGFDRTFHVQDDILGYIEKGLQRRISINYYDAVYLSTNNMSKEMYEFLVNKKEVYSITNELIVMDQNSAGVALTSLLADVPFIVVKVAENNLAIANNLDSYSDVLGKYIDLGKAVVSTINDISRSDILEGDE